MIEQLPSEEIESLLKKHIIGRLACHADGETYIVPISYAYTGDAIYCHTLEGKKVDMLRRNPRVCFEVDEIADMANWKSVIAWGRYEELPERGPVRNEALQILLQRPLPLSSSVTTHLGKNWPFSADELDKIEGIVFRIAITEKTGRCEKSVASPIMPG